MSINTNDDSQHRSCIEPLTPPHMIETANAVSLNLLPEKSKKRIHILAYEKRLKWRKINKTKSWSENVLLTYFSNLSKEIKLSTLWSVYSMLKTTINMKHNINIGTYPKLQAFLKRKSTGFKSKKSKVLTSTEIKKFIDEAPNIQCLVTKVSVIQMFHKVFLFIFRKSITI